LHPKNDYSLVENVKKRANQLLLTIGRLSRVTSHTFADLYELEELYLAGNGLQTIEPHALTSLKKLRTLDLSDNSLAVLHDSIFQVRQTPLL
jgi:Leucine-rich repeat (LRR) protein